MGVGVDGGRGGGESLSRSETEGSSDDGQHGNSEVFQHKELSPVHRYKRCPSLIHAENIMMLFALYIFACNLFCVLW